MTAAWMWARADLRRRWRSWVVLGLLAGVSTGLVGAALAGARRTQHVVPNFVRVVHEPDAAVLANDPNFGPQQRAAIARLPEVTASYPFVVPFLMQVKSPAGFEAPLVPASRASMRVMTGALIDGRAPDPSRADEIVVNTNARNRFDLHIGATITLFQEGPQPSDAFEQRVHVVGITKATDKVEIDSMPSFALYEKYRTSFEQGGVTNEFVDLRRGQLDLPRFQADVQRLLGHPVNVPSMQEIDGVPKILNISKIERGGLVIFALTVIVGAGVLVGQALVRAVSAGAAELDTWRALGADRAVAVPAMVAPAFVAAVVAALSSIAVAIALSPRFPIALSRRFDLDVGFHADWLVLASTAVAIAVAVSAAALVTALLRTRSAPPRPARSLLPAGATANLPASLEIGTRLATEPGRGRRAVPVRSAFIGAMVGVLGFVGCLTFRAGLKNTVDDPTRSGVVWDHIVASDGRFTPAAIQRVVHDPAVAAVLDGVWARAVRINGHSEPVFGTQLRRGDMQFQMVTGRAPRTATEIAFAPATARHLHVGIGDHVQVGAGAGRSMRVVGIALVPATSHTDYDESGWMTADALARAIPPASPDNQDATEEYVLLKWRPNADVKAATHRLAALQAVNGQNEVYNLPRELPAIVVSLGELRSLPLALAIFFALLASATVAHALVTTVRRRSADLAILRSMGFTRRDTRVAIAWQATILAAFGLVVGVPLGIIIGRTFWRQLAESFPVVYVPPLALVGVLLVVPVAIAVANLLAAGPAHAATRLRPAEVLRTE